MRIDVTNASEADPAGVLNDGYWGMGLHPNTNYEGSFHAKKEHDMGPIAVSLVANQTGKVQSRATASGIGVDWKEYHFALKTSAIEPSMGNHLVFTVTRPGTLWLNVVTLFPPTYHNRSNGTRVDLMEKLAAIHPTFLRFPGGNCLEGDHLADRYDWGKNGPLVDRPAHPVPGIIGLARDSVCWDFSSRAKTCTWSWCSRSMPAAC
jgi:alpha-N-arabinofuranosidase